jgi:TP53 regulating kinase-like protein
MARDVNVLLRTLDLYGDVAEKLRDLFWRGYREEMGQRTDAVKKEVEKLRASGRYVER